jgi:hypothetical protein
MPSCPSSPATTPKTPRPPSRTPGLANLAAQDEQLLAEQGVLGDELGARLQGVAQ